MSDRPIFDFQLKRNSIPLIRDRVCPTCTFRKKSSSRNGCTGADELGNFVFTPSNAAVRNARSVLRVSNENDFLSALRLRVKRVLPCDSDTTQGSLL